MDYSLDFTEEETSSVKFGSDRAEERMGPKPSLRSALAVLGDQACNVDLSM